MLHQNIEMFNSILLCLKFKRFFNCHMAFLNCFVQNLSGSLIAICRFLIGINTSYQYDEMQRSTIIEKLASYSQNSFSLC